MTDDERLSDLLLQWEERYENGEDIPAHDLCKECPALADELAKSIADLKRMDWAKQPLHQDHLAPQALLGENALLAATQSSLLLDGRYRLENTIAEGGAGQVVKGFDLKLERSVAIKLPKPGRLLRQEQVESFLLEARHVAQLNHPGFVPVHDVLPYGEGYAIISDFIDGTDLGRHQRTSPLPLQETVRLVSEAARHLHHAHQKGLIHRDIKPANLLVDKQEKVFITDFGIAVTEAEVRQHGADSSGTLAYMSPEQLSGDRTQIDARTDIYSLGVILYELLTGQLPFRAETPADVVDSILRQEPRSLRSLNPSVPRAIERVCLRCLAKNPAERYQTTEALADALDRWLTRQPFRLLAEKSVLWVGGTCGLIALILGLIFLRGETPESKQPGNDAPKATPVEPLVIRELRRFDGHTGAILSVAFSADGSLALSGGEDAIRIWKIASGKQLPPIAVSNPAAEFHSVAFSPDAKRVLAYGWAEPRQTSPLSDPGGLRLWDVETGRLAHRSFGFEQPPPYREGQPFDNVCLTFTPDGQRFAWSYERLPPTFTRPGQEPRASYKIQMWDTETVKELQGNGDYGRYLTPLVMAAGVGMKALKSNGNYGWSGSYPPKMNCGVRTVAISPNGQTFLFGGQFDNGDFAIQLKDMTRSGSRSVTRFEGHTNIVRALAFFPDSRRFLSGGEDKTIRIWDIETRKQTASLAGHTDAVTGIAVSPSGRRLLSVSSDHTVKLWNLQTEEEINSFVGHKGKVRSVAFSPDGRKALTGDEDGVVRLLELPPENTSEPEPAHGNPKKDETPARQEESDPDTTTIRLVRHFEGHTGAIHGVYFWPNSKLALSGGEDAVRLWDTASGKQLRVVDSRCRVVAFSSDAKQVLSYGEGQTPKENPSPFADRGGFRWLGVEEGNLIEQWGRKGQQHVCLAASPVGNLFLISEEEVRKVGRNIHDIRLVSPNPHGLGNVLEIRPFVAEEGDQGIRVAAFCPDEYSVVFGGGFGTDDFVIRQLNLNDKAPGERPSANNKWSPLVPRFVGHTAIVTTLAFVQGGHYLLSGSEDKTIRLWNFDTGKELNRFTGHTGTVNGLVVTPSGQRVLSVSSDNTVRLWEIESGKEISRFTGHKGKVLTAAISLDGKFALTAGNDGTLNLLALPSETSTKP